MLISNVSKKVRGLKNEQDQNAYKTSKQNNVRNNPN